MRSETPLQLVFSYVSKIQPSCFIPKIWLLVLCVSRINFTPRETNNLILPHGLSARGERLALERFRKSGFA
jgi:hypothetical protein